MNRSSGLQTSRSPSQVTSLRSPVDSKQPAAGVPRFLRPAPTISQPADAAEHEAEAIGMRLTGADRAGPTARSASTPPAEAVATAAEQTMQGGESLPGSVRAPFEQGLGQDFSSVRIHQDGAAAAAAQSLEAGAYTYGRNIVFGSGRYAPDSTAGQRLLGHELAHVAQQARGSPSVMRATGLEAETEVTRQSLRFDTEKVKISSGAHFNLGGNPTLASNVTESFDLLVPDVDALKEVEDSEKKRKANLWRGLRSYSRALFDLIPGTDGKAVAPRLNQVRVANLDLSSWGGPTGAFRFSAIGSNVKGAVTVRLIVEQIGASQVPMTGDTAADDTANKAADKAAQGNLDPLGELPKPSDVVTARIDQAKAAPHGLKRGSTMTDAVWKKVIRSLDKFSEQTLKGVKDVSFEVSTAAEGASGEAAEFSDAWKIEKGQKAVWTRSITLYSKITSADDANFAFLLAHELGHGIDSAPTQGDKGRATGYLHDDKAFKDALKKDGGLSKAVTQYGATADKELFAESMAMYVQQPETLRVLRPNTYAWFLARDTAAALPATTPPTAPSAPTKP